ncbi:uncharacterized protein LOC132197396 [Neocloeon triangulifer]|uniref:uncharacterized protein LOC132197396 n=1 Tax=Neocloeon triangulifer TaxID=2078957 RepID=UPI00286F1BE6|nr:uncharacterized protein LOC132197396 [Neocloeon triangulifer]
MAPLKPISLEQTFKLKEFLRTQLPDSIVPFNWISTQLVWEKNVSDVKVQILCPGGDWSDGTLVCLAEGAAASNKIFGVVHASEDKLDDLKEALMTTDLIDWKRLQQFSTCLKRFLPIMDEVLQAKGYKNTLELIAHSVVYYMNVDEALNHPLPDVPDNVRVASLDASLLDAICEIWPSYDPDYRPVVLNNIKLNGSFGVFVKSEEKEKLASMAMHAEYGGIGVLQTVTEFRRRGFAEIVLVNNAKSFARKGLMPYGNVLVGNDASISLFKKCGFRFLTETATVFVNPNKQH